MPLTRAEVVVFLVYLFPVNFALFHAFIFLVWYYWDVARDVAIGLPSLLLTLYAFRLRSFLFPWRAHREGSANLPFRHRSISAPSSLLEVGLWYAVTAGLYAHLHAHFGFPTTINRLPSGLRLKVLLLGYGTYFLVVLPLAVFSGRLLSAFGRLAQELARIRHIVARITAVLVVYVSADIVFALGYRLLEVTAPGSFTQAMPSFTDAFYFSTVTLTTLGFGDIAPLGSAARLLVAAEALAGIVLLGVFLAAAFSLPRGPGS